MRSTHVCPKCSHGVVLHVPQIRDSDQDTMTVVTHPGVWANRQIGAFEAYICRGCGYTEFYVRDVASIKLSDLPEARELRARDALPFR